MSAQVQSIGDIYREKRQQYFHISNFVSDGFVKVCDVLDFGDWRYININHEMMWAEHYSWVYMIVVDGEVVKVGETERPLGLRSGHYYQGWQQPVGSSKCRLGRLAKGDSTDSRIRCELREEIENGAKVEIWARRCPVFEVQTVANGQTLTMTSTVHKQLETRYLIHFSSRYRLPRLNCSHK